MATLSQELRGGARLILLAVLLSPCLALSAKDGSVRVAVLSGEGARSIDEANFARLEAELSQQAGVTLVERQQIRKVLAEHKLAANGLADPTTSARLGQLLAADLFLFIEKLTVLTNTYWRTQIIEAQSGVVLHSVMDTAAAFVSNPALLREALQWSELKRGTPPERRHFIAVLGARSEELGRGLDPLAAALSSVLSGDLESSAELVLLDREHLRHLREEERLTDRELSLKTSAVLLEAGLKHDTDTNRVMVTLVFRPLAGDQATRVKLTAPARDFGALRQMVGAAVREHFQAAAADEPAGSRDEAVQFARRAAVVLSFGETEEAVRAAEAAVALYPHPEICQVAYQCVNASRAGLARQPLRSTHNGRLVRRGDPGYADHPTETKVRLFKAVLREFDLDDLGREFTTLHPDEAGQHLPLFGGGTWGGGWEYIMPVHADETEAMALREELFERTLARHLRLLDDYARRWNEPLPANLHGDHPQLLWIKEIWTGVGRLKQWAIDDQQWARHIQGEIDRALNPPGPLADRWGSYKTLAWVYLPSPFQEYCFRPPEERRFVRKVLENLSGQTNAALHFAVRHALFYSTYMDTLSRTQAIADARTMLEVLVQEMPLTHPVRRWDRDRFFPRSAALQAFNFLSDQAEKKRYAEAILNPMIAARDWERLETWGELFQFYAKALNDEERHSWAERLLAMVKAPGIRDDLPEDGHIEKFLRQEVPDRFAPRDLWANYEVHPLLTGELPPGEIMTVLARSNDLVLVWFAATNPTQALVTVTRMPHTGGPAEALGQVTLPSANTGTQAWQAYVSTPDGRSFTGTRGFPIPHSCRAASDGRSIYVATLQGGLGIFRPGSAQAFTPANGLPVREIHALAALGGKLFLGAHGLFEFDPATERFRELASNRSLEGRNPLDGGRDYRVTSLIPTPHDGQQGLRVGITVHGSGSGVWRYDLATGQFEALKDRVQPRRPHIGTEEFEGGDGLYVTKTEDQPPTILNRLPDGRALSPIRVVQSWQDQLFIALPREIWSVQRKAARKLTAPVEP